MDANEASYRVISSVNLLERDEATEASQPWHYRHPVAFYPWWIARTINALAHGRR